ncbi:MAG: sulfotransferase domain-containing protein [Saprospiraceae bacterium]
MKTKKLIRRAYGWWKSQQIKDADTSYQGAVLLAGSARSGTTWLAELINYRAAFRYIFEPFNRDEVKLCQHFAERQHLLASSVQAEFQVPLAQIMSGQFRNPWTDFYNTNSDNSRRLIKTVRANFMLPYFGTHFAEIPIVFLLRHPFAVAHSRMKLGWSAPLEALWEQENLRTTYLQPYDDLLKTKLTVFERQVLFWCLENKFALSGLTTHPRHKIIFYENFILEPRENIQDLFNFLALEYFTSIEKKLAHPSQSVQTRKTSERQNTWQNEVPKVSIEQGLVLLARFGMNRLYGAGKMPC